MVHLLLGTGNSAQAEYFIFHTLMIIYISDLLYHKSESLSNESGDFGAKKASFFQNSHFVNSLYGAECGKGVFGADFGLCCKYVNNLRKNAGAGKSFEI